MYKPVQLLRTLTAAGQTKIPFELLHPFKYRQRNNLNESISVCVRHLHQSGSLSSNRSIDPTHFNFKKALIVTKLSRFEFEQHRNPQLTLKELEKLLCDRGTDFNALVHLHKIHKQFETEVANSFKEYGIEVKLANRVTLLTKQTQWADIMVPIGGDGTFLLTASRACPLLASDKPIMGFNSDPTRSEGRLMLSKQYTENPKEAVRKLTQGEFSILKRSRIRITLLGQNGNLPKSFDLLEALPTKMELNDYPTHELNDDDREKYRAKVKRILPYLALNEVFIGERLSARVSHLHLKIDNQNVLNKTKSSGLCVSTGTGSSSWLTSINRLSTQNVRNLLVLANANGIKHSISAEEIANKYNNEILFPSDDPRLCYSIREQICVGVWPKPKGFESKGYATNLLVKSRCIDASLFIDGSIAYPFNDGAKVLLEVRPEDSLLNISLS